jgi:hypothetical protein
VRSRAYVRARVVTGCLFIGFGLTILVRSVLVAGWDVRALIAPLVLGAALVALGVLRIRDFLSLRRTQS